MTRLIHIILSIPFVFFFLPIFSQTSVPVKNYPKDVAYRWNEEYMLIDRYAIGYRPCPSPRALAYLGLSAYEASVKGMDGYNSIAAQLPGLNIPQSDAALEYHWPTVVNASYHYLMVRFFAYMNPAYIANMEQLYASFNTTYSGQISPAVFQRSVAHGEAVASTVWTYAQSDIVGHNAHLNPVGNYQWQNHVSGPSSYTSTEASVPQPVFSYFGAARVFAISEAEKLCAPPSIPYSEEPLSPFRLQAEEVIIRSNANQSFEDKWIAEFWSDDMTNMTFSPPSRLISIANQVIKKTSSNLEISLYTYAKIGLSLNDAAVSCWHSKYYYNLLRPVTYIQRVIDQSWKPTLTNPLTNVTGYTPSFPAFPSGHSTFASAGCKILSDIFGENFTLTDSSHVGRTEFVGTPRTYTNFSDMAAENAYSRIPLGVHFRIDCDEGLALGYRVAAKVNALPWKSAPNTPQCEAITITAAPGTITIGNLVAPNIGIQVFNSNWASVYTCSGNTCAKPTTTIPSLSAGNYFVKVNYYNATWSSICEKSQTISVPGGSNAALTFNSPTNITINANQGATTQIVNYPTPIATTTCPGGAINYQLVSGLPSGSAFPIGATTIIYQAADNCANSQTQSFTVTVNANNTSAPDCNAMTIASSGSAIIVSNLIAEVTYVKITNATTGQEVYKCVGNCTPGTVTVPNLPNGLYNVRMRLMRANYTIICERNTSVAVSNGGSTCSNITTGGTIAGAQSVCADQIPATLTSSVLPTGGSGNLEYIWLSSTTGCPDLAANLGQTISGATAEALTFSSALAQTTTFRRYARRAGCTAWAGASNCITVTVTGPCPSGTPCDNVNIVAEANTIKVSGLSTANIWGVQIFNAAWTKVFSCSGNACTRPITTIPNLLPGTYFVKINCYTSSYSSICKKEQFVTITAPALASSAAVNFSAQKQGKTAQLTWQTHTPPTKTLDYFVLERAQNNQDYEVLQVIVEGLTHEEAQNFATTDQQPLPSTNFYRLRAVYADGTELLTPAEVVSFHKTEGLLVYPNPTGGDFAITMDIFAGESTTITMYNLLGQEVLRLEANDTDGQPLVIENHHLEVGIYQIAISSTKGVRAVGRVAISDK